MRNLRVSRQSKSIERSHGAITPPAIARASLSERHLTVCEGHELAQVGGDIVTERVAMHDRGFVAVAGAQHAEVRGDRDGPFLRSQFVTLAGLMQ